MPVWTVDLLYVSRTATPGWKHTPRTKDPKETLTFPVTNLHLVFLGRLPRDLGQSELPFARATKWKTAAEMQHLLDLVVAVPLL